jgi:hypothetical protein
MRTDHCTDQNQAAENDRPIPDERCAVRLKEEIMDSISQFRSWLRQSIAGTGIWILAASPVLAQGTWCPPPPCPPITSTPSIPIPPPSGAPGTGTAEAPVTPSLEAEGSALALSGSTVAMAAPGYVDFAVPITQFRLRFDAAYNNNRPDRAEFFYAKCGCFAMLPPGTPGFDPDAHGPPLIETRVDYQELRPYFEYAFSKRFSTFVEAPIRFINPEQNSNEAGFSNLLAGLKYAVVANPCQYLTFQFVTSTPTADTERGLGNDLVGLEPGILWYRQLTDRLAFSAELRDWIPIGGTDFAGNILRSGGAISYLAINGCNFRVIPIGEVVSWTVLSGKQLAVANPGFPNGVNAVTSIEDAAGDTIVNAKIGVRIGVGQLVGPANMSRSEIYIGYGRALTGEVWYKDVLRLEYALRF